MIVTRELGLPSFVATKGDSALVCADIDIFRQFRERVTILVGLSNLLPSVGQCKVKQRDGVKAIGRLKDAGITVESIVSPVLPGITDLDEILAMIPDEVTVLVDRIRTGVNTPSHRRFLAFIKKHYASRYEHYAGIADGDSNCWQELLGPYLDGKRIKLAMPL